MLQQERCSNRVRFALTAPADCVDGPIDETVAMAAPLALPVIINGRIGHSGEEDLFRVRGRAGARLVADVVARRLGSPLDSVLTLSDEAGRVLATNDDSEDKAEGLLTHHADSQIALTLPADGVYLLRIADAQRQGGPEHGYRLRIGAPKPDFELRVVPSAINLRAGASVPITVHALRRDGFAGEIALALADTGGFTLSGARIPAGESQVKVTLKAANVRDEITSLHLLGRATIGGDVVTHAAVPADDMMQAFAYHHLVPAQEWRACIVGRRDPPRGPDRGNKGAPAAQPVKPSPQRTRAGRPD
jgi:hypothetical protein